MGLFGLRFDRVTHFIWSIIHLYPVNNMFIFSVWTLFYIQVPWSRLGQEPVIVYLDQILILAEPATHVEESNEDAIQEAKRTRVQVGEIEFYLQNEIFICQSFKCRKWNQDCWRVTSCLNRRW